MALTSSDRSIVNPLGANQLLPRGAGHFEPITPQSNRVQPGCLDLVHSTSPLGAPSKANPAGAQTS